MSIPQNKTTKHIDTNLHLDPYNDSSKWKHFLNVRFPQNYREAGLLCSLAVHICCKGVSIYQEGVGSKICQKIEIS